MAAGIIFTSCEKKSGCMDESANNYDAEAEVACEGCCAYDVPSAMGSTALVINHQGDGNPFSMNNVYTDDFGNDYKFTRVQYYLSGHKIGSAGNPTDVNMYMLVDPSKSTYAMRDAEAGTYSNLMFTVGVDSAANHADPAIYESTHPLAFQNPSTHWSWNSGYIFVMLEGQVDTDNDGIFEGTFTFHIGMDSYKVPLDIMVNKSVEAGTANAFSITANYTNFLTGIDLETENLTHTMNNMMLANKVKANVASVFSN